MSDETPGAVQGALPPKEGQVSRSPADTRPQTVRLTPLMGQYMLASQPHPSLTQISPGVPGQGVTRIISISPSRVGQVTTLRPSLANQSIVSALTNSRTNPASSVRLQLFPEQQQQRPMKRPSTTIQDKKEAFAAKLQRVMNHRIVRSKIVKEKYNEHLQETFHLENGHNILDLYQFAKRPKSQLYLNYLKENAIDPREVQDEPTTTVVIPQTTPSTPTATSVSSLPGITTNSSPATSESTIPMTPTPSVTPKPVPSKIKSGNHSAATNQEMIVEKAKQEAYVVQRVADLQKEGLWTEKRLPKLQEAQRAKAHWDFLLEEMIWLAADFAQERKWKKAAAKKCARMVQKYFQDKALAAQRAEKAHEQNLRRLAAFCAKEVKNFWNNVEKLVEYKQNTILEEKRKKALDQQLSFIVDQTEKYSQLLAEGMNKTTENTSSRSVSRAQSDTEFDPDMQSDEDDEETIAQEEATLGNENHTEEVEALQKESQMELEDMDFLREYLLNRDKIRLSDESDNDDESEMGKKSVENELSESEKDDEDDEETEKVEEELKLLVEDSHKEGESTKTEKDDLINDAAAIAESIQPKGNTLSSTNVSTNVPFLLKYPLREYQHIGLDWLVTMFDRKLNGILADEMGLGKTIQTIALLAHLACEKENWGPHLIIVPTSVILNWEMEFKKWCPAFKILTYYGTQKERKFKRTGWTKPNAFHVCITSYKLVIQDHQSFRRKKWKYLILDEAQNIKNFKSQRWQLLLNFQTQQRLLLTGTPLQNNLMELWSLMHFLMPNVFQSHREFKEWFSNPVTGMIEGNSEYNENIIKRLHKVLRPFLLRRLKSEVEKQMPKKYEHVVMCRLSKRQRYLYDDYMSRAKTKETLASGSLLSVINVLMQLRKVCNHPNLFETRPVRSPFQCDGISIHIPSIVYAALEYDPDKHVNLIALNLLLLMQEMHLSSYQCYRWQVSKRMSQKIFELDIGEPPSVPQMKVAMRLLPEKTEIKPERKEVTVNPPPLQLKNLKVSGVHLVNQQGIVKTIPVVNVSQTGNAGTPVSVASVLKSDRISGSYAQLVQTSTGKHLLLTQNPNITTNMPVTTNPGGQKFTFLSNKPVSTIGNSGNSLTKAFVKVQVATVTSANTTPSITTTNSVQKKEENLKVGHEYIAKLYSKNQNNTDVPLYHDKTEISEKARARFALMTKINVQRCSAVPLYGRECQECVKIFTPNKINVWNSGSIHCLNTLFGIKDYESTNFLQDMLLTPEQRIEQLKEICERFILYVPPVKAPEPDMRVWHPSPSKYWGDKEQNLLVKKLFSKPSTPLHHIASAMITQFPDPRLIQYDCGKLQTLDRLLRKLKMDGHRVLIFTQMTKMLDVLEAFLNFHGHIYLRLDGTTKIDQRQVLMERFNGDPRIFAFILSTRSGGVGVNLTGADTVIFYDSDWNPTMDAQAQDRCHRIGQTRDVHIYRLISERTIEENILKKANQKRLLGDIAIEGGNFTTAYFKSSTIQDLFNVDSSQETAAGRMSEIIESKKKRDENEQDDKVAMGALENALAACEDKQDVIAARTAKAEAVADLAEFDEDIPLEETEKEPEVSKAEQEINNIMEQLSPVERYAMKFIETTESAWSAEQLAAAEREIEEQKREWELNRIAAMREEEERRARELEEENDMLTYSREDASNQIWVSDNTIELMPMWGPPTPPQQDNDVYCDQCLSFLYDTRTVMSETQLPPIYVRRAEKRSRHDSGFNDNRRPMKIARKEETNVPKSLFHSPALIRMRRDMKIQKLRGMVRNAVPISKSNVQKNVDQPLAYEWFLHEDQAILKVLRKFQGLPLNPASSNPGHTPNWDFVADYVNTLSITYRSPKHCKHRYETVLVQREEGKVSALIDVQFKKKKNKANVLQKPYSNKSRSTPTLLMNDDNIYNFTQLMIKRFESLKSIANKRLPTTRTVVNNPLMNKTKTTVLNECGIDLDHPVLPVEVAARRAERMAKEKKLTSTELARLQMMKGIIANQQGNNANSTTVPIVVSSNPQIIVTSTITTTTVTITTPSTAPSTLRTQRLIASPLQTSSVMSVSGLSPAQLQAATQRLIVPAGTSAAQAKTVVATAGVQGKQITPAQLLLRQTNLKQQLRIHANNLAGQGVKTSTVTIGGQQAVVQFSQAQQPRAQFVRQGTVTVGGKTGVPRAVSETEMAQLLKKQHLQQQQKLSVAGTSTIQSLSSQVLAQAIQAGTSGTPVATLVKAVSTSGVTQTVTIPVTGVTLTSQGKTLTPTLKTTNPNQIRQFNIQQQQLLTQKKLAGQKLSIAQVAGKSGNLQTQLIVGSKPLSTGMTVQQFQQVIRSPLNVSHTPVVLTKGPPRVIPVNTAQGTKQTIQVVAATSQTLTTALRPQSSSTLAGALTGIKVNASSATQQALLSLNQNVGVRQGSPVRIQTTTGTPIVAVSVQNVVQTATTSAGNAAEQVSKFFKK